MITKEQERQIAEKKAEIERLKEEIKSIRGESIRRLLDVEMYYHSWHGEIRKGKKFANSNEWGFLLKLVKELHRHNHQGENLTTDVLSGEERTISAKLAKDIIKVWNKYMEEILAGSQEG